MKNSNGYWKGVLNNAKYLDGFNDLYPLLKEIYDQGAVLVRTTHSYRMLPGKIPKEQWEGNYKPKLIPYKDKLVELFMVSVLGAIDPTINLAKNLPQEWIDEALGKYGWEIYGMKRRGSSKTLKYEDKIFSIVPKKTGKGIEITIEEYFVICYLKDIGEINSPEEARQLIKWEVC